MKGARKFLVFLAGAGFIAALSAWIGIKVGRPLYYSDGQEAVSGYEMADSGMLRWTRPAPRFQLPGRVRGRVAALPDGRLLYGQPVSETQTDLVVYDPQAPGNAPQPVFELNTAGHELAPSVGPSGTIYFASDRPTGAGGFDLYQASYREGIFFAVRQLPEGINTGLDETDPAVDRVGGQLAFVRRDPEVEDGRNGQLMLASLADPESSKPVFPPEKETRATQLKLPPIDRDPSFAPDGLAIYFVREQVGQRPVVLRTFWHRDGYVPPIAMPALAAAGDVLRGPTLEDGGFGMRLVSVSEPAVVYQSAAEEVYPYWEGQWWIEWLLLVAMIFFAVLLLLLILGARWHQLDVITKLLLLSMLIHLLLLLWMSRMEITRSFAPDKPGTGDVEVRLIARSANSGETGSTEVRQNETDISRSMQFEGHEAAIASGPPGTEMAQVRSELEASESSRPSYQPTQKAQDARVADAAERFAARAARSRQARAERQELATRADTSAEMRAEQREQRPDEIVVTVPASEASLTSELVEARSAVDTAPAAAWSLPTPRQIERSVVAVGDAPAKPTVKPARAATPEARIRALPEATRVVAAAVRPVDQPAREARNAAEARPIPRAQPRVEGIAQAPTRRQTSEVSRPAPLQPRSVDTSALAVQDTVAQPSPSRQAAARAAQPQPLDRVASATRQVTAPAVTDVAKRAATSPREAVMARPASDLEKVESRARAQRSDSRTLPQTRELAVAPLEIREDLGEIAQTSSQRAARATRPESVAVAELDRVQKQERPDALVKNRSSQDATLDVAPRIDPGSLVERPNRRKVADATTRDVAIRAREMDPMAMALNDAVLPGETMQPSAPVVAKAESSARLQPVLSRVRPDRQRIGVDPRRRWRPDAGFLDRDFGVRAPGSFVARAMRTIVAPARPLETARLTPYANRFGANKQAALKKYGGDAETEAAVAKGLEYLASIQNDDGTWGNRRRSQRKYGQVFIGKTGLCLLAFLGAGHTPDSNTKYSAVTRRAIDALLATQLRGTHFGRSSSYSHGITTYALAECYAITKDRRLRRPLQRAVDWILANQNVGRDRRNNGGWGYFSSNLRAEDGFSRSSTTAWQVMALESARLSGIEIPDNALAAAQGYLLNNYDRRYGYFLYNKEPGRLRSEWRTLPASTPAAVFCLQLFGIDPSEDARVAAGIDYTLSRKPTRYRRYSDDDFVLRGAGNVYFWYYGSLACFLAGGDTWKSWNEALKRVLLNGQSRDGSFRPIDTYSEYAGDTDRDRSYTTAMCVLSLEVYYRYFTPLLKKK